MAEGEVSPLSLEDGRATALANQNNINEVVHALYGADGIKNLRALAKPDQQIACAEMMMAGLSMMQVAQVLGVHNSTISKWFARDTTDMQRHMKSALTKDALLELPKTWKVLKGTRDSSNAETARKGALDCFRVAGLANDPGSEARGGISINAQNLQFNNMSVADLDRKILEIAEKLGPDAVKLANAEVRGDGKASSGPVSDKPAGQPPGGTGEAGADGGVPGAPGGAPPA